MLRKTLEAVLGGLLAAGMSVGAAVAASSADPLANPSSLSPKAQQLMAAKVAWAGRRLVSVGERGTILLSDDQGRSWRQVVAPVRVTLTAVCFSSPQTGWAVGHGGVLLSTEDGGETWSRRMDGVAAAAIEAAAAKEDLAAAAGDEQAQHRLREAEGLVTDGPDKPFLDVHFFDDRNGLLVGAYGLAFRTEDGGATWHSVMGKMDNPRGRHLYAIEEVGGNVYVAGEQGAVFKSTDGGHSFRHIDTPGKGTYFGLLSSTDGTVLAYGLRGALYRSEADGRWSRIDMPPASLTGAKRLSNGTLLLADEAGHLWRSADGGRSFALLPVTGPATVSSIEEITPQNVIVAGARGNARLSLAQETPQ
jgi:photosystem II stability/assembly factor-like uncharacterized protein